MFQVLVFCVIEKRAYFETFVPAVQRLKFDFWGHDCVVLHAHEIRKAHGDFNILLDAKKREAFIVRVNELIESLPFTVISAVIDKQRHVLQYANPANPYEIALKFCMERTHHWLREQQGQRGGVSATRVRQRFSGCQPTRFRN